MLNHFLEFRPPSLQPEAGGHPQPPRADLFANQYHPSKYSRDPQTMLYSSLSQSSLSQGIWDGMTPPPSETLFSREATTTMASPPYGVTYC
jgi:hypothetical protein